MRKINSVAVIGAGTMGSGIAQLCAMHGLSVALVETQQDFLDRGTANIKKSLDRFVKSQKITSADSDAALARIRPSLSLEEAVATVDLVFEAVPEKLELKQDIFRRISKSAASHVIIATNTSQLSITSLALSADHPENVIGTHFFNPPVLMKLIEVIKGLKTSDETLRITLELCERLGKEVAVCNRDTVGFITSRAAAALRMECIRIYEEGIASIEDIDRAMRLGFNHPMGPFELADFNGLDVSLLNGLSLKEAYGERFNPPQSLRVRVNAGQLGRKTGSGWYDYREKKNVL